ncbi:MAG TPA: helix-hairpin-helix domain-containing protein [Solirubrobacterales bacterium]|nr:helix-hairpin-helix domain-containing protein [Solirubrobacterales bacterium]
MAEHVDGARGARAGLLESVWHRKLVVLACVLAAAGAALVLSLREQPRYEATATFVVEPGDGEVSPTEVIELASADRVAARTADSVGVVDAAFVSDNVSVSQNEGSDLFTVRATATGDAEGPTLAADVATDFTEEFVDYTKRLDAFEGRAEVVSSAEPPDEPVSPRSVRNTLIGALAGLVIGIVVAFAWERLDHRVRAARELDRILGVPLLARIPKSGALELDPRLRELPAADAEHFQMARVSLRYLDLDRELRTVLVTSPDAGDGKTTVCFCLAVVAAISGERVLVIEADMRRPGLAALAEPAPAGLSGVLEGRASLDDERVSVEASVGAERESGVVDMLLAGPAPANPTRLLESAAMAELLDEASEAYDLVLIDTPPASFLPDAVPLVGHVDGVVIVSGLGRDNWDQVEELRDHLRDLDAPMIGAIANFARSPDESYFRYILEHEAAVAEAGTVPLRPAGAERTARRARRARRRRRPRQVTTVVPGAASAQPDGAVDLNTASYDELRALDLTITQAKRVIAYRERSGGFSSLDQLDDVPGFPDEVRAELKRRVRL